MRAYRQKGPHFALQFTASAIEDKTLRGRRALFIDASIKPFNQVRRFDAKSLADSQKSLYCNRPAGFDLLPVTRRKSMTDNVFLRIAAGLAKFLYSNSQSAEELSLINHSACLENLRRNHHEQISCDKLRVYFASVLDR